MRLSESTVSKQADNVIDIRPINTILIIFNTSAVQVFLSG